MHEILDVVGRDWTKVDNPSDRGWSSTGETTESSPSLSRGCLADTGTSAVGEARREDPTFRAPDIEERAGRLEGKYCSRVEEEEGEGGVLHHSPYHVPDGRKKKTL